jgi:hypothetical protein
VLIVAVLARKKLPELHPRRFFLETWREVDREAAAARARREELGLGYDYRPMVAYLVAAVVLTFQEYFGDRVTFNSSSSPAAGSSTGAADRAARPRTTSSC